jgi:hypothetical protein
MYRLKLFALLTLVATAAGAAAYADSGGWGHETANRNFQAALRPAAGGPVEGSGVVNFRQPIDAAKIVYLDVWVEGLLPNRSYRLQRAVDTTVDDDCRGTNWLTLGRDNVRPRAIQTNHMGKGRAALSRDLAAVPTGTEHDIHFRVVDDVTGAVVLETFCFQFTVLDGDEGSDDDDDEDEDDDDDEEEDDD